MKSDVYVARLKKLSEIEGRYTLDLCLEEDSNTTLSIDIHDSLCETLGISKISPQNLRKIYDALPKEVKVLTQDGYWEISNEGYMLSNALANVSII